MDRGVCATENGQDIMREKKTLNVQIGGAIRTARKEKELTQEQFAEKMSMDSKSVSAIERGVIGISLSDLQHICERLPVSSDALLFANRSTNDVSALAEKLRCLPSDQFETVEELLNKMLEAFARLGLS